MQEATDRMPPIHPARRVKLFLELMAVFLPKLIGKEKGDDQKRHNQKRAQNQMLDHISLRGSMLTRNFIVGVLPVAACNPCG
jgi:hypothetical protein